MAKKDRPILNFDVPAVRTMVKRHIEQARGLQWFDMGKVRDQRTLRQNGYYWSAVIPTVARGLEKINGEPYSFDEAHVECRMYFLRKPVVNRETGEIKAHKTLSTTDLTPVEFWDYVEKITQFCSDYLGETVPPPRHYGLSNDGQPDEEEQGVSRPQPQEASRC